MPQDHDYVGLFNAAIRRLFRDALRLGFRDPSLGFYLFRTLRQQKKAARVRVALADQGVHVPAFMIASITSRCNLRCQGCYAQAHHRPAAGEMTGEKLHAVLEEAKELGISIVLLAGGEPLTRPEILDIAGDFPEIVFPLFTNGLLLDEGKAARLRRQRNVIPVLSLEGHAAETDQRRGRGVYDQLLAKMALLRRHGVFFGSSITLTRRNFDTVTSGEFVGELLRAGARLFFFVEYVPVQEGTEGLVLTEDQRVKAQAMLAAYQSRLPGLFIALPGDEEKYGGCLAAGRGFIHLSPEGRLEPCPFAPFSDVSLQEMSLREALGSEFLRAIRENGHQLTETRGGCALWAKRDWVQSLLSS